MTARKEQHRGGKGLSQETVQWRGRRVEIEYEKTGHQDAQISEQPSTYQIRFSSGITSP